MKLKRKMTKYRFRSRLEEGIAESLESRGVEFEFEPSWGRLPYLAPAKKHVYTPDFYLTTDTGKVIIIESKGIWVYGDRYKHLLIRKQYPDLDIRFVFSNAKSRIRKGSATTYADICNGGGKGPFKGVVWKYSSKKIPQDWLEE